MEVPDELETLLHQGAVRGQLAVKVVAAASIASE